MTNFEVDAMNEMHVRELSDGEELVTEAGPSRRHEDDPRDRALDAKRPAFNDRGGSEVATW